MKLHPIFKDIKKLEPLLFWIMVIGGILPILFTKYYPTLDGPSHLYNGKIIQEIVTGTHQEFKNLFILNPLVVPNWISHFFFALFGFVFPDYMVEKIVITSYLIFTPLFFRKICLHFAPENKCLSYLMIPFAHNHLFYFGFFNFVFAITVFLITVHYTLKVQQVFRARQIIILASLLLLIYFSHVMILMITIMVLLLLPLNILNVEKQGRKFRITNGSIVWRNIRRTLLACLPAILLMIIYLIKIDSLEKNTRLSFLSLLKIIVDIRPLMTIAYGYPWKIYNWLLAIFFVILIVSNIVYIKKKHLLKADIGYTINFHLKRFSMIWISISLLFTILFFIVPNSNLLSERLILFIFLFLILGLSTLHYSKTIRISALFVVLLIQIVYVRMHIKHMGKFSDKVELIKQTTKFIDEGSFVLPLNYSNYWLDMHCASYLGTGKPLVVLENYEGCLGWFPIVWNTQGPYKLDQINNWGVENKRIIRSFYINAPDTTAFSLKTKTNNQVIIPYVVKLGKPIESKDDDYLKSEEILSEKYQLIFQNDFCQLYHLKQLE